MGKRIAIVEDDPTIRANYTDALKKHGYEVAAYADRKTAIEALREIETGCVREAVAMQKAVGLGVCTDGEFHRRHWFLDFIERVIYPSLRQYQDNGMFNEAVETTKIAIAVTINGVPSGI